MAIYRCYRTWSLIVLAGSPSAMVPYRYRFAADLLKMQDTNSKCTACTLIPKFSSRRVYIYIQIYMHAVGVNVHTDVGCQAYASMAFENPHRFETQIFPHLERGLAELVCASLCPLFFKSTFQMLNACFSSL